MSAAIEDLKPKNSLIHRKKNLIHAPSRSFARNPGVFKASEWRIVVRPISGKIRRDSSRLVIIGERNTAAAKGLSLGESLRSTRWASQSWVPGEPRTISGRDIDHAFTGHSSTPGRTGRR